jgi:hypothetical protein
MVDTAKIFPGFKGSWNGLAVTGEVQTSDDGQPVLIITIKAGDVPIMRFGITAAQAREDMRRLLNLAAPMLHALGEDFKVWLRGAIEHVFPKHHDPSPTVKVAGVAVPTRLVGRLPKSLRTKIVPNG